MISRYGRKFMILIAVLVFYCCTIIYVVATEQQDKGTLLVSIATGLTMIVGSYFAGNVFQKNTEK